MQKFNKTYFADDACKGKEFSWFEKTYTKLLRGHDLKEVFSKLGGIFPKKRASKKEATGDE